jgi:hypothetical protein
LSRPSRGRIEAHSEYVASAPPEDFVTASRAAMGGIDLDPYSTKLNNSLISARTIFNLEQQSLDEILQREWGPVGQGRTMVFCPSGMDPNRKMLHKLLQEYRAGRVKQATILLTNSETATKCPWIWDFPVCMPFRRPRVRWWDDELKRFGAYTPPHWGFVVFFPPAEGEAFLEGLNSFHAAFSPLGRIVFNELSGDQTWQTHFRQLYRKDYVFRPHDSR